MEDLEALYALWTDPGVRRYLGDGKVISGEKAKATIEDSIISFDGYGFGLWVADETPGDGPVGFCGLRLAGSPRRWPGRQTITASRRRVSDT